MDNPNANHRNRLREKIRKNGIEALSEHEVLEYILFSIIPRKNTNHIAHDLIEKFGSIAGVFNAGENELQKIDGVGKNAALYLRELSQVYGCVERGILFGAEPRVLDTSKKICDYSKTFFFNKLLESAYMFSLNGAQVVVNNIKLSEGAQSEAKIYVQSVVRAAIDAKACTVILAHNHPCGTLRPSSGDILLSEKIARALKLVDVDLLDSVIVAGGEAFSLRDNGFLTSIAEIEKEINEMCSI